MSKGLEAFKVVCDDYHTLVVRYYYASNIDKIERSKMYYKNKEEMAIVEKELKALEIIKNVGILKLYETSGGQCWLEAMCDATKITKDNYDLLKEVGL